jgi:hypothetical protein
MKQTHVFFLLLLAGLIGGCASQCPTLCPTKTEAKPLPTMTAKYTQTPVKLDGKLDDPAWKTACVYPLYLSRDDADKGQTLTEPGEVRLAWDDNYFYVAVKFIDSDIVAEGKKDQKLHYRLGDLCEVFLKNDDFTWYWELYGTPRGKKSNFFFPGWGRNGLPSMKAYTCDLAVAAQAKGTVNDWKDKDEYFTVELAMPIKDLTAFGGSFGPDTNWRILVARYNYSRYIDLNGPEYSMTPPLSKTNYHLIKEYAKLRLEK